MTSQVRHAQLFNILNASTPVDKPKRPLFVDDETALRLLRSAKASWALPQPPEALAPKAGGDDEFFRTVRP